jgi:hypothetical protein
MLTCRKNGQPKHIFYSKFKLFLMSKFSILLQTSLHFLLIFLLIRFLNLNLAPSFSALCGGLLIDLDCLPSVKKTGLIGYLYLKTKVDKKPRFYKLHNLISFVFSAIGSLFVLTDWTFVLGIFFLSMLLHLLLDFAFGILRGINPSQLIPEVKL